MGMITWLGGTRWSLFLLINIEQGRLGGPKWPWHLRRFDIVRAVNDEH